ncbi:hypothetical protein [Kineosporia sp. A_224]|uniref:hypothetical protein n=1 Tax=Kineosporia sp. A_224 TaxID=1962180 RepID=UPI000B4B9CB9|nr:hypothetical protein [Kineosporia sp. A_224]
MTGLTGWLTAGVALAAVSLVGFDAVSVGATRLSGADLAAAAASRASGTLARTGSVERAYADGVVRVHESDPTATVPRESFRVDADGGVHLVVRRTARTHLLARVPALRDRAVVEVDGSTPPAP